MPWDCKVTPADCTCQEGNTTGCIPSNDGLGAGLGPGFPHGGKQRAVVDGWGGAWVSCFGNEIGGSTGESPYISQKNARYGAPVCGERSTLHIRPRRLAEVRRSRQGWGSLRRRVSAGGAN